MLCKYEVVSYRVCMMDLPIQGPHHIKQQASCRTVGEKYDVLPDGLRAPTWLPDVVLTIVVKVKGDKSCKNCTQNVSKSEFCRLQGKEFEQKVERDRWPLLLSRSRTSMCGGGSSNEAMLSGIHIEALKYRKTS